jgi:hypothetical protein
MYMDPNIENFQTEEQKNDNIIIKSHIQPTDNTYEDEQVCIYDYLDQLEKFLSILSKIHMLLSNSHRRRKFKLE